MTLDERRIVIYALSWPNWEGRVRVEGLVNSYYRSRWLELKDGPLSIPRLLIRGAHGKWA